MNIDTTMILSLFYFFLPAGLANMAPVFFAKLPFLKTPIDFNKKLGGQPILGPNKTYRGLLAGILAATLAVWIQKSIYSPSQDLALVDYSTINIWQLGFLLGFGALAGDAIKSFFKRRAGIKNGDRWVPFDQIDWILGAIIMTSGVAQLTFSEATIALVMFGLLHPAVNLIGYALKLKPNKL
jgi:CDP-2,3-bis-(O-geranylgeranyl)-sn-glycerol synthase